MSVLQTRTADIVVVASLLVVFAVQSVGSMRTLSTTSDETSHLPAGYTYVVTGDLRLNPQHPPLVKILCGVPLLFLKPRLDLDGPAWSSDPPDEWRFGYEFLYANDAERLLFWGRLPIVGLALLLGLYVHRWAREMFGDPAAWTALTLYAFSPNVLAHSHLVTMDVALACFGFAALYHLWRFSRNHRRRDMILAGTMLGLALASKFSAVVLLPVVAALLLLAGLRDDRLRRHVVAFGWIVATAVSLVWLAYLLPSDPGFYLDGIRRVNADRITDYPYFLMGEFRVEGWWYYFVLAFLFKTPLPTLVLIGAATISMRKFPAGSWTDESFLMLPVVTLLVVTSALADNLGVRYLLPIYPLLFVHASRVAAWFTRRRWTAAAAVLLAAWYVAGAARIYPHHLSYFNVAVGGPGNGHRLLDDSNIDWGQGLRQLAEHLDRASIDRVRLLYGWNGSPDYWGIRYVPLTEAEWTATPPPPGVYAITTHLLIRGEHYAAVDGLATDWLSRYEPIARVGYHTYIFRFGVSADRSRR